MTAGMPRLPATLGLTQQHAKCFSVEGGKGNSKEWKNTEDNCTEVDGDIKTCFHKNQRKRLHLLNVCF